MEPSKALMEEFHRQCEDKCYKYKYWWCGKAAHVAWNSMNYEACVNKCVRRTLERARPEITHRSDTVFKAPGQEHKCPD